MNLTQSDTDKIVNNSLYNISIINSFLNRKILSKAVNMYQLAAFGYKNLNCINTCFDKPSDIGIIQYQPGDITKTAFNDNYFEFITCLSVIEHGVDLNAYFNEMNRILKPNGVIITSTDYWKYPMDTHNKVAYGVPIKIFSYKDLIGILAIAEQNGFEPIDKLEYDAMDEVISWEELNYTFIYFSFRKCPGHAVSVKI